jgi:hypothetical protein
MTETISSVEETVVHGDIVTTITETKTVETNFLEENIFISY